MDLKFAFNYQLPVMVLRNGHDTMLNAILDEKLSPSSSMFKLVH